MDQPWYGIGFGQAIKVFFQKGITFSGRASRGEYWWPALFQFIVTLPIEIVSAVLTMSGYDGSGVIIVAVVSWVVSLVFLVPTLAVTWRRVQDIGKPGWLGLVLALVPWVLNLVMTGTHTPNMIPYALPLSSTLLALVLSVIRLVCYLVLFIYTLTPAKIEGLKYDPRGNDGFLPPELVPVVPPGPADPPQVVSWG